jgi:hypothetical protein
MASKGAFEYCKQGQVAGGLRLLESLTFITADTRIVELDTYAGAF